MATAKKPAVKNIYEKLFNIMIGLKGVEKTGQNTHSNYAYVEANVLIPKLRELLIEERVLLLTSSDKADHAFHPEKGSKFTTVHVHYTIVNVDNPEEQIVLPFLGEGYDSTDKGIYKGFTGALKYFIMDNFLVPIGLDPEQDNADEKAASSSAKKAPAGKKAPAKSPAKPAPKNDDAPTLSPKAATLKKRMIDVFGDEAEALKTLTEMTAFTNKKTGQEVPGRKKFEGMSDAQCKVVNDKINSLIEANTSEEHGTHEDPF